MTNTNLTVELTAVTNRVIHVFYQDGEPFIAAPVTNTYTFPSKSAEFFSDTAVLAMLGLLALVFWAACVKLRRKQSSARIERLKTK